MSPMTRSNQRRSNQRRSNKMRLHRTYLGVLSWSMAILITLGSCGESHEEVSDARRVTTRTDLVGGPGALGELEDFVLENSRIKLIVQNQGYSRGFGVYGGGIIDADLVRPTAPGNSDGATGRDTFGELFPVYFLQALEPDDVQILDHDAHGAARVQVSGFGGEFLSITKVLNRILLNSYDGTDGFDNLGSILGVLGSEEGINAILKDEPRLRFEVLYSLKPGVTHVDIETTMTNVSEEALTLPSDVANLLFTSPFSSPGSVHRRHTASPRRAQTSACTAGKGGKVRKETLVLVRAPTEES